MRQRSFLKPSGSVISRVDALRWLSTGRASDISSNDMALFPTNRLYVTCSHVQSFPEQLLSTNLHCFCWMHIRQIRLFYGHNRPLTLSDRWQSIQRWPFKTGPWSLGLPRRMWIRCQIVASTAMQLMPIAVRFNLVKQMTLH